MNIVDFFCDVCLSSVSSVIWWMLIYADVICMLMPSNVSLFSDTHCVLHNVIINQILVCFLSANIWRWIKSKTNKKIMLSRSINYSCSCSGRSLMPRSIFQTQPHFQPRKVRCKWSENVFNSHTSTKLDFFAEEFEKFQTYIFSLKNLFCLYLVIKLLFFQATTNALVGGEGSTPK